MPSRAVPSHSDCDSQHQTRVEAGAPATWPAQPDHTRRGRRILHASSLSLAPGLQTADHTQSAETHTTPNRVLLTHRHATYSVPVSRVSWPASSLIPRGAPQQHDSPQSRGRPPLEPAPLHDGYSLDAPGAVSLQCRFPLVGRAWRRLHVGFHSLGRLQCRFLLGGAGGHLHDVIRREDTCKL